ncbi:MAG: amino acid adenylation domain-containing protein [Ardenticatenaceae bacterium]|nr:amino acid adenylation domain-containing protein [Ardenticatenaceae bacterium]
MSENLTTADFLAHLHSQGITVWADGQNLRFNAPRDGFPPALRDELVARKTEVLAFLTSDKVAPASNGVPAKAAFAAPRTPLEMAIATLWQQLLGRQQIGIHDIFFEQGGDSILATQTVSWIRQTYGVDVSLRALFTDPTVAGLAHHIDQAQQAAQTTQLPPLQPRQPAASGAGDVLSFAQQRSWFLDQLTPENPFYNMPKTIRLVGQLNVAALSQTLNEIVRRHETLRTVFALVDGHPRSFVTPQVKLELRTASVQHLPEDERLEAARQLLVQEVQRPFDLTRGPLIRPFLVQLSQQEHILQLTMHHIASDGWSTGVLHRELVALYPAFCAGQPAPLPDLPLQYADFAAWQRRWLTDDVLAGHLAYWQGQLANLSTLELPTDHPRPPVQTVSGARQLFKLPADLTQALEALSQQESVTLFMLLLATFQTLLHRYANQEDIVIGSPIANRNRTEIEGLIGFFANMLVLRTDFSNNPSFRELLQRVKEVALSAYEHQDLPFEKLVEELQPERDLSRTPMFQVVFALQNAPMPALKLPNLTLSSFPIDKGTAAYDINMAMWQTGGALHGRIEYNTDLFDADTVARFIRHFQQLLTVIVAAPDTPVAELPLLTLAEEAQLAAWNNTQADYPQDSAIHHLFEAQAAQTPGKTAVTFANQSFTYAELNQRANQMAHYLQHLGVGPETLVGLCVERSLEMFVGLLGILKAGGAYLPLDPAFPPERLAYMVEDAQLAFLVTQESLIADWQWTNQTCQLISLDGDETSIATHASSNLPALASTNQLAYTIYTSGSTGRPKGVQIPHRAVVNFLNAMRQQPGLTQEDVLLSVTTLSFDIAVLELFLPLVVGAEVMLVSREVAADGAALMAALAEANATVMQATPTTWRLLLAAGWAGSPTLKILCGGEALPPALANELVDKGRSLWNLYGPTETTIWSACYQITGPVSKVPIGRPIANTQIYVLDTQRQPVPIGVIGEIYIAGDGLARGYYGRPELTSERFVADPWGNGRMYKTGDQGRWLADGNIEFLGRNDHQVKVRGYRIELGEIEANLNRHPGVGQAVLTTHRDASESSALVAYIIPADKTAPPASDDLRAYLGESLPDYMIPHLFIFLETYPLTPNGKIDRKVLPAPEREQLSQTHHFVAPGTAFEEVLAEVWEEVLNLAPIGIHDNFFNLGGHSLLATQVVSRIRDRFEIALPVRHLFEAPTIAQLADRVEQILLAEIEALDDEEAGQLLEEY